MAFSFQQYTGDGTTTVFSVPFAYLQQADVGVKVNGSTVSFTWQDSTHVVVSPAPASGAVVEVRRTTPKTSPNVTFQDGSVLGKQDLNTEVTQLIYIGQEAFDAAANTPQLNSSNQFDATSKKIINVADPTNAQDAATKNYVDSTTATSAANAANSASQASTSATNASNSATAAANSASQAATSATNASNSATAAANSAASTNLPNISTANGGEHVRVKADKTGYEFRTPSQVLTDIGATGRLLNIQYFLNSGTYTPTAGTTSIVVEVQGGGGAGGGTQATGAGQNAAGGGGGAGGYAVKKLANPGTQTVTIGAAGASVVGGAGGNGGTTSFGAIVSATGGNGGTTSAVGSASSTPGGAGGSGSGGDLNITGAEGGTSLYVVGQGNIAGLGGNGMFGQYGRGGKGTVAGASSAATGGSAGTTGLVVVKEYA